METPDYDEEILSSSEEVLNTYIAESDECLVVDRKSAEQDIIDWVAELLPGVPLGWNWDDEQNDLYIAVEERQHKVGLLMSPRDRYITLRRLNEVMAGKYEVRLFRHTFYDSMHCFYVRPCEWWAAM